MMRKSEHVEDAENPDDAKVSANFDASKQRIGLSLLNIEDNDGKNLNSV
jgi:hypothetical protein